MLRVQVQPVSLLTHSPSATPMPYILLGQLISVVMLGQFLLAGDASLRSKLVVTALLVVSVLLQQHPAGALPGFLLQMLLAIGLGML